jgi:hypothetical protein
MRYSFCDKKIRNSFFKADKSKMVNGVSVSATTQHIEATINANNIHPHNQCNFCCQDYFLDEI